MFVILLWIITIFYAEVEDIIEEDNDLDIAMNLLEHDGWQLCSHIIIIIIVVVMIHHINNILDIGNLYS